MKGRLGGDDRVEFTEYFGGGGLVSGRMAVEIWAMTAGKLDGVWVLECGVWVVLMQFNTRSSVIAVHRGLGTLQESG